MHLSLSSKSSFVLYHLVSDDELFFTIVVGRADRDCDAKLTSGLEA